MKKTFTILAVALMALSACNKEGGRMPGMTEYIAFDSYTGGVTRTASITTENIRNFGAAAYTGSVKVMDNQLVEGGNSIFHAEYYSENDAGRQVPQIMFNLQSEPNGGDGLLLIWELPKDSKNVNLSIIDTKTQQKYAGEDYNVSFRFFD